MFHPAISLLDVLLMIGWDALAFSGHLKKKNDIGKAMSSEKKRLQIIIIL
jgi:hypothetical protein